MRLLLPKGHCDTAHAFEKLKATCNRTWAMIKQRTSLRRACQLRRAEGQRMQQAIHAALKRDHAARTAQVGKLIVAEFAEGNIHEAFWHLKGWYQNTSETQAKPCFHTIKRQTLERVELYRRRDSPAPPHHHR